MKFHLFKILIFLLTVSLYGKWELDDSLLVSGTGVVGPQFGYSVDVGNHYAVVGAADDGAGVGTAYVFKKEDDGSWTKHMELPYPVSSITTAGFGSSVAIAESPFLSSIPDFIVVGAPNSYTVLGGIPFYYGEICIYERNSTTDVWEQHQACLFDSSTNALGYSVDISSYSVRDTIFFNSFAKIVAGDPKNDTNDTDAGAVMIYDYNVANDIWTLAHSIYAPNDSSENVSEFGYSVALYNDTLLIGAPFTDITFKDTFGTGFTTYYDVGAAFFYDTQGTQLQKKIGSVYVFPSAQTQWFGWSVDMSYEHALIGLYDDAYGHGGADLYEYNGTKWSYNQHLTGSTITSLTDRFSQSLSINDKHVVIGAPEKKENGETVGAVYIYDINNEHLWEESTKDYGTSDSSLGNSVSLHGDILMVGAPGDENARSYKYEAPSGVSPALIMYMLN
jgi:hypothetical protein